MRHYPHLDALRAIAVLLVIAQHTLVPAGWPWTAWDPGGIGVRLFFVLSGFLITGILVEARVSSAERQTSWRQVVKAFYIRRSLRILPLAYAALVVAWLLGFSGMQTPGWYFAYLANWKTAFQGSFDPGLGHFWSLAVEEQFYLVWPVLVLLTPPRSLPALLGMVVVFSLAARYTLLLSGAFVGWTTVVAFDALAVGSLMALWGRRAVAPAVRLVGGSAWVLLLVQVAVAPFWLSANILGDLCMLAGCAWLVWEATNSFPGTVGRVAESGPVAGLGKIAYGVYVIHGMLPELVRAAELRANVWLRMPEDHGIAAFTYVLLVTLALAIPSWFLFERPINDLKRHFPYVAAAAVPPAAPLTRP